MSNLNASVTQINAPLRLQGRSTLAGGSLSAANAQARTDLFPQTVESHDPRGHHLRLLREQQNRAPAQLATQACLSLRQYQQLENGETSLFYSEGLRNQAGRRVAALLGADWDQLGQGRLPDSGQTVAKPALAVVREAADTGPELAPAGVASASAHLQPVPLGSLPMGLLRPTAEMPDAAASAAAPGVSHAGQGESTAHFGKRMRPLLGWACAGLLGAGTGWALAVWAGVRL